MQKQEIERCDQEKFRFVSRKQYEDEIKRLISLTGLPRKKLTTMGHDPSALDEMYEALVEEYVCFCSSGRDVK
jgi:hypothetical protein